MVHTPVHVQQGGLETLAKWFPLVSNVSMVVCVWAILLIIIVSARLVIPALIVRTTLHLSSA